MRPRVGVAVCVTALALGGLTGLYVLPAGGGTLLGEAAAPPTSPAIVPRAPTTTPTPGPSPSSVGPTPSSAAPTTTSTPSRSAEPLTERDLLAVSSFADQSVTVTYASRRGETDAAASVAPCLDPDAYTGPRTLKDFTGHDPELWGLWNETSTDDTADQVLATVDDTETATADLARIATALRRCERAEPGQEVYGPVRTLNVSSSVSSSWFGSYPGEQNTSGRAPTGTEPCGGLLLSRNGPRLSVAHVYLCLDSVQLAGLAQDAARRLASGEGA